MRPGQPQGRRARERPPVADIDRRAEEPRPQHPLLEMDRHRVRHRHTQSLPHQQEHQQRGDLPVQNDPNNYQDGHRRYHSSAIGRIGPHAPDNISTPSLAQYSGTQYPGGSQHPSPRYQGPQFQGTQFQGPQHLGPQHLGPQYIGPQHPSPHYPGLQYPGSQYLGPRYPGPQSPGLQYPGLQSTFPPQLHSFDNTYRPMFDEYGIPQVIDDIPRFQDICGQSSSTFDNQMFTGRPDPQAGIQNSTALFDSIASRHGYRNPPYLFPDPRFDNSFQEQGVNRDPFQSLLSSPYLLPAPLPSSPIQRPVITQDSYQPPSSGTSHLAMAHEQMRSRAARNHGSNLRENQTTVDPQELNIVEHDLHGLSREPADQTSKSGERHGARHSHASAAYDQQLDLPNPGSAQQLHTPTRQRASHNQDGSRHSQGQDSGKRKRRAHSSPEAGSSPKASSSMTSIADRRQGQNPRNASRVFSHPQQEKQTPKKSDTRKPDTSGHQDRRRSLIVRLPSQSGIPPKKANRRRALSSPEAGSSSVMTDHEREAEAINPVFGKGVPHDDRNDAGNSEQQQADDAQTPGLPNQDSDSPSRPPKRVSAKKGRSKRRSLRSNFFDDLDACNGVIIPSKLEPGEGPRVVFRQKRNPPKTGGAKCPICRERFGQRRHLKQHFAACVNRNGNPDGHCWDDLLEDDLLENK